MFGYIMIDKPELKVKEYYQYKAYYCGLCHKLNEKYGFRGRMTLTYDMTFLIIVLTSLYEPENEKIASRCPVHPIKKIPMLGNEFTEYAAKMNIILTYFKFEDDWKDDKSLTAAAGMHLFRRMAEKTCKEYPRQAKAIQKQLKALADYEMAAEENLDLVAGTFGKLMEELFVVRQDMWEEDLRKFGFYLGKYIYIMDAYDDLEKDLKTGSYNPLKFVLEKCKDKETYEQTVHQVLLMMMAEATAAFEKLPCLEEANILRNILYSGVWGKYNKLQKERQEKEENHGK